MTTTFTLDGKSSTTIPELVVTRVRRSLVGDRRDEYLDVPGRSGFVLFPEAPGRKKITIEMQIQGGTFDERRDAVVAVADLLDLPGLAKLIVDDEPDRFYTVKLSTNPDPEEWLVSSEFSVEFAAEPYAQATTISDTTETSFPAVVNNAGEVIALPVIQLTAAGSVDGYRITIGELVFEDTDTIANATTKTVNSISYVVTDGVSTDTELDGSFDPNALSMAGVSGDFPLLLPGDNTVNVEVLAGGGTLSALIQWRQRSR